MCARIDTYLELFSSLKNVPQEPVLLLSILDLISARLVCRNFFDLSREWEKRYLGYCSLLAISENDATRAFISLGDAGFWHLAGRSPEPAAEDEPPSTLQQLRERYLGARVNDDLYPLLIMETSRKRLYSALYHGCFTPDQQLCLTGCA